MGEVEQRFGSDPLVRIEALSFDAALRSDVRTEDLERQASMCE